MSKTKIITRNYKPRNGKRKAENEKTTKQLTEIRQRSNWQKSSRSMLGVEARVDERPSDPDRR